MKVKDKLTKWSEPLNGIHLSQRWYLILLRLFAVLFICCHDFFLYLIFLFAGHHILFLLWFYIFLRENNTVRGRQENSHAFRRIGTYNLEKKTRFHWKLSANSEMSRTKAVCIQRITTKRQETEKSCHDNRWPTRNGTKTWKFTMWWMDEVDVKNWFMRVCVCMFFFSRGCITSKLYSKQIFWQYALRIWANRKTSKKKSYEKKGVTKVVGTIVLSSHFTLNVCKCENKHLKEPTKKNVKKND